MERQTLVNQLTSKQDPNSQDLPSPKARFPMLNDIYLKKSRSPSPTAPGAQPQQRSGMTKLSHLESEIHRLQNQGKATEYGGGGERDRVSVLVRENDALLAQNSRLSSDLQALKSGKNSCMPIPLTIGESLEHQLDEANKRVSILSSDLSASEQARHTCEAESMTHIRDLENARYEIKVLEEEQVAAGQAAKASSQKITDLQKSIQEIKERYQQHVQESRIQSGRQREVMESLKASELRFDGIIQTCNLGVELSVKYNSIKSDHDILNRKHDELLRLSQNMESRLEEARDVETESYMKLQEQVERANDASMERQKVLLREENLLKEVGRLEEKVVESQERYRDKAETEIATIRTQFIAEKNRLNQEIADLETSCAKVKLMAERAVREKRSAESELEKLTQHLPSETERLQNILDDLTSRLHQVHAERTETQARLEGLQVKHSREISRLEKEKYEMQDACDHSHRMYRKLVLQHQEAKDETVKLTSTSIELEHNLKTLKEASSRAGVQHSNDLSSLTENYEAKLSDLTSKLADTSALHAQTCEEMQQLLATQRTTAEKWASESRAMDAHFQARLTDSRDTATRLLSRTTELESTIEKVEGARREAVAALAMEKSASVCVNAPNLAQTRMYAKLATAEQKADACSRQVQQMLKREGELVGKTRAVERDFKRISGEKKRMQQQRHDEEASRAYQTVQKEHNAVYGRGFETSDVEALVQDIQRVKARSAGARSPVNRIRREEVSSSDDEI